MVVCRSLQQRQSRDAQCNKAVGDSIWSAWRVEEHHHGAPMWISLGGEAGQNWNTEDQTGVLAR
jgi:hypothetical protein